MRKWVILLTLMPNTGLALAGDPSGIETLRHNPGLPVDYIWVLVCAFLVMFMQAGFAMLEAGFCRSKNVANLIAKNLIDYVLASLVFFVFGYALMVGNDWKGILGRSGWMMLGDAYDVGKYLQLFWMTVFCGTAATIVSGAVAERLKFGAYLLYTLIVSSLIYPICGHWIWGGGWLAKLPFGVGAVDFAGSGVVHALGGLVGLAGAYVLGPRYGKYRNGAPQAIPGHSLALAGLGVFILWFGWFGFNAGSTYTAQHLRISVIAVNTNLAAAAGGLSALLACLFKTRRWDVGLGLNGVISGLVAITAPCAWVEGWASVLIGAVAGVLMYQSVRWLEERGIDDPVGAVSVHGICGLWGILSVGIFADGTYGLYSCDPPFVKGLLYGGGFGQLISQSVYAVVLFIWALGTGLLMFKLMDRAFGIRVNPEVEIKGLDVSEHHISAYPEFSTKGIL